MMGSEGAGTGRAAVEQAVTAVWREVLTMPEGGESLTFFDLQGQSISAVRIVARIEDELSVTVDVGLLFEDPDLPTFLGMVHAAAAATRAA